VKRAFNSFAKVNGSDGYNEVILAVFLLNLLNNLLFMAMYKQILFIGLLLISGVSYASEKTVIRFGVLAYGTVNWELEALKQQGLLETADYRLQVLPLANPQAGKIALLSGAVDMIVADWVWVSRQRSMGKDYTFYPYSNTTGALVVAKNSSLHSLKDLKGKKLAVAGGKLDKNHILLGALMQKKGLVDKEASTEKFYGAPPLLAEQLKQKRVDALLTYWHYAARLEAEGYKVLMTGGDILQQLGIKQKVPSIGYVFSEAWASKNTQAVQAFLVSTKKVKNNLCAQDSAWQGISDLTRASTAQTSSLLRQRYCAGRVLAWGEEQHKAAELIYQALIQGSGRRLTGNAPHIVSGTFW